MTTSADADLAWAYINGQKAIDAFDRREASKQLMCFAIDRELERRREKRSQRQLGESATEVSVGEFKEAAG
jgi:hypothetical protein